MNHPPPLLELPRVTLLAIDGHRDDTRTRAALARSCAGVRYGAVRLYTANPAPLADVEVVPIQPLASKEEFNHFQHTQLAALFETEFVLTVQWDGWVLDPARWEPAFLAFDYIGAPWSEHQADVPADCRVGNGGFSLRSRRLCNAQRQLTYQFPEDYNLCVRHGPALRAGGVQFAPVEVAARFSAEHPCEYNIGGNLNGCFGFHGPWHITTATKLCAARASSARPT